MRTFNPKQEKYESKTESNFKFATFNKNLARVKAAVARLEREKTKKAIEYKKSVLSQSLIIYFN
jgi:hypothetical protein